MFPSPDTAGAAYAFPPVHISALGFVPRSAKQRLISVNAPACLRACLRARPTAWTRETTGREARIFFSPFPDTDRPAGDPSGLRLTHASHLNLVSGSIRFFCAKVEPYTLRVHLSTFCNACAKRERHPPRKRRSRRGGSSFKNGQPESVSSPCRLMRRLDVLV